MPGKWRFTLVNVLTGAAIGDVSSATARTVRHAFNGRLHTASVTVRADHPLADVLHNPATGLVAWEGTDHRFTGVVQDTSEAVDGSTGTATLVSTFADVSFVLGGRLLGQSFPTYSAVGYTDGTALAPKAKGTLIANMLAAANAIDYTGLDIGTVDGTAGTGYVAHAPFKAASEAMLELAATVDGPDIAVTMQVPQAVGQTLCRLGRLEVRGTYGTDRPAVVFEHGTGKRNVAAWSRRSSMGVGLLTRGFGLPGSDDPTGPVVRSTYPGTYTMEGLVASDVPTVALRQASLDEQVRLRAVPRRIIQFTPARYDAANPGRVPVYGVDYFLGDVIRFRVKRRTVDLSGRVGDLVIVNAAFRVYAVDFSITEEGASGIALTLTSE